MYKPIDVDDYIAHHVKYQDILLTLRAILLNSELEETIKWNMPTYTIKNKNVITICAFKHQAGIWFHHGSLLSDPLKVLTNAQEGKTVGMRHWKFSDAREINESDVTNYFEEAIENEKLGHKVVYEKKKRVLMMPEQLTQALKSNPKADKAFKSLTISKQIDYAEYISSAKRASTVEKRLLKVIPLIAAGKGLLDMYKST